MCAEHPSIGIKNETSFKTCGTNSCFFKSLKKLPNIAPTTKVKVWKPKKKRVNFFENWCKECKLKHLSESLKTE